MDTSTQPLWNEPGAEAAASDPFVSGTAHDVIVVGAGITGLTTAVMLAERGVDVAVIEAGGVAVLSSGANTGKLSLLQGSVLGTLRRHHPAALVRAYVDANRDGADWLIAFARDAGVPFTRRTAYSYAARPAGLATLDAERAAANEAGLDVREATAAEAGLPFEVAGAIALDDQVAIDPKRLAEALAERLRALGGRVHTHLAVTGVHAMPRPGVDTAAGSAWADQVVLATGTPIVDRGLYFAKTRGLRSYCVAFEHDGAVPDGMLLSVDDPDRSLRSVTDADGPAHRARLIVGGAGHPVGRAESPQGRIDELVDWTARHFPGATPVAAWSAQDYESHDLIPFVGAMPRSLGRIRFATGYGKWGLSNAPAAAMRLVAEIQHTAWRERPDWMRTIARRMTVPADLARGGAEGLRVSWEAATGWVDARRRPVPVPRPAEGVGIVASRGGRPVGISTVDGVTRAVNAVCPHLGGVVAWNDAEHTWDCPLHASRFRADGTRIEGPARCGLQALDRSGAPVTADAQQHPASAR